MKTQRTRQPATLLLIFIFVSVFGIAVSVDAQKVHALLVLLGNDTNIEESVAKNEEKMVNMLKQLSYHCNVQLTLMHSKSAHKGTVEHKTFVKGRSDKSTTNEQDIIQSRQVVEWLENLNPTPEDTVLVYYSGHGKVDSFGTHTLVFDFGLNMDTPDRGKLSQKLKQKPARLRMLITDTCSNFSQDLSDDTFAKFAVSVRAKARPYMQDLFLEHEGFLDITAASPGQFAIGHSTLGGHFTSALLSQGFTVVADTDRDGFLSWQEAFEKTVAQTKKLYQAATFDLQMQRDLRKNKQNTQEPFEHSLPTRIGGRDGAEMVLIPAGEFQMGSNDSNADDDEKPVHTVYVDGFYMDKYEVTVGQYKQFIRATGHRALPNYVSKYSPTDKHPVVGVSWHDAMAYAQWAGKRLPTEAEWEKAARGGLRGKRYPWGNAIDSNKASYGDYAGPAIAVGGKYPPNGYGLYDMAGNVWELCLDEYNKGFYKSSPSRNPISGDSISYVINNFTNVNSFRVLRGGSWGDSPENLRVANRFGNSPAVTGSNDGFRCARAQ